MNAAEPFVRRLSHLLEAGREERILQELEDVHAVDIAQALSELSRPEQVTLFHLLDRVRAAEVLQRLDEYTLRELLPQLDLGRLATVLDLVPVHRTVALITRLRPEEQTMITRLSPGDRAKEIGRLLRYKEGTAARLMSPSVASMPEAATVAEALARIRAGGGCEAVPMVYVVDGHKHLINVVPIGRLLVAAPQSLLRSLEHRPVISVTLDTTENEVAHVIRRYGLWSVPVLDEQWRFAGSISIHDIIPAIHRAAVDNQQQLAGAHAEMALDRSGAAFVRRLGWRLANLAFAVIVASAVGLFETSIQTLAVLAVLMPIVASMGRERTLQTMSLLPHGLGIRDMSARQIGRALKGECELSFATGLPTGLTSMLIAYVLERQVLLSAILGAAVLLTMLVASVVGVLVPLTLRALKISASGAPAVIATTMTDFFSFFCFLGLATLLLRYLV
jgi:magnesium transporter